MYQLSYNNDNTSLSSSWLGPILAVFQKYNLYGPTFERITCTPFLTGAGAEAAAGVADLVIKMTEGRVVWTKFVEAGV